jgi:NADP-dependent 3-hydroxy acid dehydrogenase YdfG
MAALDAGHSVVATVRSSHSLPVHERLTVHHLDVRDRQGAFEAVTDIVSRLGRLDVLVNNAGYGLISAVEEASEQDARDIGRPDGVDDVGVADGLTADTDLLGDCG